MGQGLNDLNRKPGDASASHVAFLSKQKAEGGRQKASREAQKTQVWVKKKNQNRQNQHQPKGFAVFSFLRFALGPRPSALGSQPSAFCFIARGALL